MQERTGQYFIGGKPMTLVGTEIKVGDKAPDATVLDNKSAPVNLSAFRGRVVVLCTVPSLDTSVCDTETRTFNKRAAELSDDIAIVVVSADLPYTQKRWCGAAGIDKVSVFSDHRETAVGLAYGLLVKELRILARAVLVIDKAGAVQYIQLVPEMGHEPDYDAALVAAKKLV
jgi:thiol peroxidase